MFFKPCVKLTCEKNKYKSVLSHPRYNYWVILMYLFGKYFNGKDVVFMWLFCPWDGKQGHCSTEKITINRRKLTASLSHSQRMKTSKHH